MTDDDLLEVLGAAADAVRAALDDLADWGPAGTRPGQYRSDLVADAAAVPILKRAGLAVMSEESGMHQAEPGAVLVALDPVDGSTNASRRLPWFATSLCAIDDDGPRAALVVNQATGERFEAVRGAGARVGGAPIKPSGRTELGSSIVALSGYPPSYLGWKQYRALGAAALDLCAVAAGAIDAYIDCTRDAHAPWDYLGGALVCAEAGASVVDAFGRDLLVREIGDHRTVLAAATPQLLDDVVAARGRFR